MIGLWFDPNFYEFCELIAQAFIVGRAEKEKKTMAVVLPLTRATAPSKADAPILINTLNTTIVGLSLDSHFIVGLS